MERVIKFIKKVIYVIKKPYMRVLPGQLAFFTVLSLVPLIAILATIASYFSISFTLLGDLDVLIPKDITTINGTNMLGKGLTFNIIIFLLTAFLLASNGAHSIIITSNEIYGIKGKGFIGRRLKSILITFILVCVILFTLAVPIFGENIFNLLKLKFGNIKAIDIGYNTFNLIKIPITMFITFFLVKLIYNMAPDEKEKIKKSSLGPLFTTIMWILSTEIYSFYVREFSNYNVFYGSISNIIILMIWLYYLSYVFVLGMAISATGDKELELTKKISIDDLKRH